MRDEIRKRIEAVRRGEVPEGYQQKAGYVIPGDWHIEAFSKKFKRSLRRNTSACNNGMEQKEVVIPPDKAEQEAIGAFFSKLDNLITLHQRELEAEQQKKKALMQLLLTGLVRVHN